MSLEELKKKCEELIGEHIYNEYCDIDMLYDKGCDVEKITNMLDDVADDIWENSGASKEAEKYEKENKVECECQFIVDKYGNIKVGINGDMYPQIKDDE